MDHRDAQIADIIVVLDQCTKEFVDNAVKQLDGMGVDVADVDANEGVIEGTVDASRVKEIEKLPCVKYVRTVLNYTADYPAGDPRDQDTLATADADLDEAV